MEKIYMEDNNNKKSKTNRFLKKNGIVTASALIAIVAVFAFVATSFNNPSWAIDDTSSDINNIGDHSFNLIDEAGRSSRPSYTYVATADDKNSSWLHVPRYWADGFNVPVFCLEEDKNPGLVLSGNKLYYVLDKTDKSIASDYYGVLYILANGYYDKNSSITKELSVYDRTIVTQLALWNYLYDKNTTTSTAFKDFVDNFGIDTDKGVAAKDFHSEISKKFPMTELNQEFTNPNGPKLYNNYIAKLVSNAKKAKESDTLPSVEAYPESDDISLTSDKKYYQSSAIVTVSNTNTKNFKVSIDDSSPKGTILVDESGVELKEGNHTVGEKFFVRVPVDSVGDNGATVNLSISAVGFKYTANVYRVKQTGMPFSDNYQRIVGVDIENHEEKAGVSVKFDYTPEVPDTGMSTSQIIYFIGLVILVCGVGIVYANIKPKESN